MAKDLGMGVQIVAILSRATFILSATSFPYGLLTLQACSFDAASKAGYEEAFNVPAGMTYAYFFIIGRCYSKQIPNVNAAGLRSAEKPWPDMPRSVRRQLQAVLVQVIEHVEIPDYLDCDVGGLAGNAAIRQFAFGKYIDESGSHLISFTIGIL